MPSKAKVAPSSRAASANSAPRVFGKKRGVVGVPRTNDIGLGAGNLPERLKHLRKASGLTLSAMSEATGLSVSGLSKVEAGQMQLSYGNLVKLAGGLGVDIVQLFSRGTPKMVAGMRSIAKANQGVRYDDPGQYAIHHYLFTDLSRKSMDVVVSEITASTVEEHGGLRFHEGQEIYYVLEGAVWLHTDVYEPVHLEMSEAVYIDGMMGHALTVDKGSKAKILSVVSCSAVLDL